MKYHVHRSQQLNCDIVRAWAFFSSPFNLAKITPPELGFEVLTELDPEAGIHEGQRIEYRVSPLFGIPMKWTTRITQTTRHKNFMDVQEKGPYKLWNHLHSFEENDSGVLMTDKLTYELPFGPLGRFANWILVRRKVEEIFDYRRRVLEEMFNTQNDP